MSTLTKGQTVYTENGQECIYVSESDGEHIVRPIYDHRDSEPTIGKPFTTGNVFNEAPVARLDARVAELEARLVSQRNELAEINREITEANRDQKDRMARLKQHRALQRLDDYLAGKITHFVVVTYFGVSIVPAINALQSNNERYDREMKLLTLYGCSNGDLQFRINYYSDGSGSSTEAYPFTSKEEAQAFAKDLVAKKLAECIAAKHGKNGAGIPVGLPEWSKVAASYGIHVPEEVTKLLLDYSTKNAEAVVAKAKDDLVAAEAKLAALSELCHG